MKVNGRVLALAIEALAMVGYAAVETAATVAEMRVGNSLVALEHIRSLGNRLIMINQLGDSEDEKEIEALLKANIKAEVEMIEKKYKRVLYKKNSISIAIKNELATVKTMLNR